MNLKRLSALVLALAMTASTAALAAGEDTAPTDGDRPLVISSNPFAGNYDTVITINGEKLESYEYTRDIPGTWETETVTVALTEISAVPTGYVPLRAVVQADHGSASWYKDENQSYFYLNGTSITTDFGDMSIEVDGEKVEEAQALLINGVTYVPVSVLEKIEGVTVTDNSEGEVESYDIATPNGTPLMKLAYLLKDGAGLGFGMKNSPEQMEQYYGEAMGFQAQYVTEGVFFTGVNTTPDTLAVGKVAEGHAEDLAAFFEAYRQRQADTFSWYLSHNLPKVENAKFVTEGDWFLFVIAEKADETVEQFKAAVAEMG